jgi:hypothetical protein
MNHRADFKCDVVIVGGGIAGIWLLNLLIARGYSALVLEADALGCKQTLASQGMIHGGLKYALSGNLTRAAEAIATMPARWRACLAGAGEVDLRGLEPLSEHYYLFAEASTLGKLATFFASKSLRGRINKLTAQEFPAALAEAPFNGAVYELQDFVFDTRVLLERLLAGVEHLTLQHRLAPHEVSRQADGYHLQLDSVAIETTSLILTAGAGTGELLAGLDIAQSKMQLRALHQVIVHHDYPHPLYAHCLTGVRRAEPRLTITSHREPDGAGWLWYLGGQLATDGVALTPGELVTHARRELETCVPWINWGNAKFETLRIDRAEPAEKKGGRPDRAYAQATQSCLVCWPTKLSLVPDLGDRVLELLPAPCVPAGDPNRLNLPRARIGRPAWEHSEAQ